MTEKASHHEHGRGHGRRHPSKNQRLLGGAALLSGLSLLTFLNLQTPSVHHTVGAAIPHPTVQFRALSKCAHLHTPAGPPPDFHTRTESDRYVPGTPPVHIKNATIWSGGVDGHEVIHGDILLYKGLVAQLGSVNLNALDEDLAGLVEYDAKGAWVSPGIFDLHSHMGVYSLPSLEGASDGNSIKGDMQPWLRSIDALNTHDDAYVPVVSGGVTTGVVLPGSANGIGGQAFVIKYRPTKEKSPSAMLLEPPHSIVNGSQVDESAPPRWRQMKHACGENPSGVYGQTRMDTIWHFREAYNKARIIKEKQDAYCEAAVAGSWAGLGEFPDDLQWEALVDVLRGRVKVHNHCYEAVDLDGIMRLTNEFKFPIAAFHHAHETYLVPETLKKVYGGSPAVALFATNGRYKREAYRGSEFASKILSENGIKVVLKSDHPVLNSRYLLHEAQLAHYFGLPANLALASVTTTPAGVAGMGHRVGSLKSGYDADLVIWDSHPLALGATPKQVYIDGMPQLDAPFVGAPKPAAFQKVPETPDFDEEAKATVQFDGLPPLKPKKNEETVVFTNVESVFTRAATVGIMEAESPNGVVVVRGGKVVCSLSESCANAFDSAATIVDLMGGSIAPGLISFGSPLGLEHIAAEGSTNDGTAPDPLPGLLGPDAVIRAADGLLFESRDMLLAYRSGVTIGVTAPSTYSPFVAGLSTAFSTGAEHKLEKGAVVQEVTALHVGVSMNAGASVSTQVAVLRRLLKEGKGAFGNVIEGEIPLVVNVDNADIMATLVNLKKEIGGKLRMTFVGGSEAHLLANEIAAADIGVVLIPSRSFPVMWEGRRFMPGPPLSQDTIVGHLVAHNITVGLGVQEQWAARNTRFDVGWAALSAYESLSKADAMALATTNLEQLLGLTGAGLEEELVVTRGGTVLDFEAKVVGVISGRKGMVDLF